MKFSFVKDTNLTWIEGAVAPVYKKASTAPMIIVAAQTIKTLRPVSWFIPPAISVG
jgi:hypothetical protein